MPKINRTEAERKLALENRKLMYNLKRRIMRIKNKYGANAPAVRSYEKSEYITSTRNLSLKELQSQNKQLKYLNSLKTSRIKGAKYFIETFTPLLEKLQDKTTRDKFFEVYNKAVEENRLLEKYKYEIYELIEQMLSNGASDEEIRKEIEELFNELSAEEQGIGMSDTISF